MESVAITGNIRAELGKKPTKAIRNSGEVPCVIYGSEKVVHFSAPALSFRSLVYSPEFKQANIDVDGTTYKCILKDIQFHPVSDDLTHMDFLELVPGNVIKVEIPVRPVGIAPGVKLGGKLSQRVRRVKVKTTPENLVDHLTVDVSGLKLGESVRVRDIDGIEGVELMSASGIPVISVEIPRALRAAAAAAEEEEEA